MRRFVLASLGSTLSQSTPQASSSRFQLVGSDFVFSWVENISVPIHPAFAEFLPELPGQLIVTSVQASGFKSDNAVWQYRPNGCESECLRRFPGSEAINWPNAASGLRSDMFGFPALVVGNGFLVPSHTTGGVWVLEASTAPEHLQQPVKITQDKEGHLPDSGWFYHMAVPWDMNDDGRLDLVTARCEYGVWPWSQKSGELIWLQHPDEGALSGEPWQEHHLVDGPDFLFCQRPGLSEFAMAAAEFVNERVVYYYMQNGRMQSRVLDATAGPGFSCSWADLDGDGRLELLTTNHRNQNGSVYAYVFDSDDFSVAAVNRHVLASGFNATSTKKGSAAPGDALPFQPQVGRQGKPWVLLSGDNGNDLFVLAPKTESAGDWDYALEKIADLGGDVGRPAVGDADGDGFADIYAPVYDMNVLVHYRFSPAPERFFV